MESEAPMTLYKFVAHCERTAKKDGDTYLSRLDHFATGVSEEAGEILGLIEAHVYEGRWIDIPGLRDELGDFLWYSTMLAEHLHRTPGDATGYMHGNGIEKVITDAVWDGSQTANFGGLDSAVQQEQARWQESPAQKRTEVVFLRSGVGMSTRASKVLSYTKKVVHFDHDIMRYRLAMRMELANSFRHMLSLCAITNISLNQVAHENVVKLLKRYPTDFNVADSLRR